MQMRTDSRGSPLRRTYLGNLDTYISGIKLEQERNLAQKNQLAKKNMQQAQVVPGLDLVSRRSTIKEPA